MLEAGWMEGTLVGDEVRVLQLLFGLAVLAVGVASCVLARRVAPRTRAPVAVAIAAGLTLVWFVWLDGWLFAPGDVTADLLGVSVAANIGLVSYLAAMPRQGRSRSDPEVRASESEAR